MFNDHSDPVITDCTFSGNVADFGAGMTNGSFSDPTLRRCRFIGNSAIIGGAIRYAGFNTSLISECLFVGNSATSAGGAVYNLSGATPTFVNCAFSGNSAGVYGGATRWMMVSGWLRLKARIFRANFAPMTRFRLSQQRSVKISPMSPNCQR